MAENSSHQMLKRYRNTRQYNEKAGDRLVVSQMTDARYQPYLQGLDTHMPEKVRHKEVLEQDAPMRAVRQTNNAAQDKSLKKMDDIEMDTGNVEIGYEAGKHRMHMAFVQNQRTNQERTVTKSAASFRRVDNSDKFYSGDEQFYKGAIDLECDTRKTMSQILRQLDDISRHTEESTTIDQVIPFQETRAEQKQIKELRALQHQSQDRSNIQSAVTALETVKLQKKQRKKQFVADLRESVAKTKAAQYHDSDFLLYLRKKKAILDALSQNAEPAQLQEILEQYDTQAPQATQDSSRLHDNEL